MNDDNLPDEYETLGVTFTRSTRQLADFGSANHALENHHADAPVEEGKHYFPRGLAEPGSFDGLTHPAGSTRAGSLKVDL